MKLPEFNTNSQWGADGFTTEFNRMAQKVNQLEERVNALQNTLALLGTGFDTTGNTYMVLQKKTTGKIGLDWVRAHP